MAESLGHLRHDPLHVAAALDRAARLSPMVELCGRCAALYRDLVALTAALPLSALPARPRAFTLATEDARRLRPGGLRSWWSTLGSARDIVTKPLAVGLTTLGLTGLLLTAIPMLSMGAGAAAGPEDTAMGVDRAAASPAPNGQAPATPASGPDEEVIALATMPDQPGVQATLVVSLGLIGAGSSLFAARRAAGHGRPVR